ncbi:MAG: SPOR domain-containing protein [Magnetococcales bacterium]|nr:SPOR domain-containing protein [Magnetococcales bacterium]
MTPRYPTSSQFRRRRNPKRGRPILLGLLGVMTLYFIFSSPSPKHPRAPESTPNQEKPLTVGSSPAAPVPGAIDKEMESGSARNVMESTAFGVSKGQTGNLHSDHLRHEGAAPEFSRESTSFQPDKNFIAIPVSPATPAGKSKESAKAKEEKPGEEGKGKESGKNAKGADAQKGQEGSGANPETAPTPQQSAESAESGLPSPPKELAPKPRLPDVDMTFYRELPKRKVVVPQEENAENAAKGGSKNAASTASLAQDRHPPPAPPPEKGATTKGSYMAQLAVFTNAQNATTMVSELQKRGVPARMVKSKDGNAYRVRVGPFPSRADAARSLMQWRIGGFNTMIYQDNE